MKLLFEKIIEIFAVLSLPLCAYAFETSRCNRMSAGRRMFTFYIIRRHFFSSSIRICCVCVFFSSFSILMNRKVKVYLRCHRRQYNFFFDLWLNMHMRFTLHFSVFFFGFKRVIFHILIINFQFWKNLISLQHMCSECVYDVELVLNCWHCTSICAGHK